MTVFLTGTSGYIGRHVAQELNNRGHQVMGLARKASERTRCLPDVKWCFAELSNFDGYWDVLEKSDAVVHCAMDYSTSGVENLDLDRIFVSRMSEFKGNFVYTGNLFSDRLDRVIQEAPITKSTHERFQTENLVLRASNRASVIRLGFVYGGGGGHFWDILSPATLARLERGSIPDVVWPMVHVRDVARLYASVLDSTETGVFHAFDGTRVKANEVVEAAKQVYKMLGISSSEVHDYIQGLLQTSVVTSNRRSCLAGWRPEFVSFIENARLAYSEHTSETN